MSADVSSTNDFLVLKEEEEEEEEEEEKKNTKTNNKNNNRAAKENLKSMLRISRWHFLVVIFVSLSMGIFLYQQTSRKLSAMSSETPLTGVERAIEEAKRIMKSEGLVMMTMLNDAYLEFALSWLCNTRWMPGVHDHVLLVTTDPTTAQTLQRYWPAVTVVDLGMPQYSGDQEYSQVGYVQIMVERTALILSLLQNGVRLLLFEADCVWLRDPLPLLLQSAGPGVDILATLVDDADKRTAGGFLLLIPTDRTLALWRELTSQMTHLQETIRNKTSNTNIDWHLNDQEFLAQLIKKNFSEIHVHHLNGSLFPDGNWYRLSDKKRKSGAPPYIINNNFIKGNKNKKNRAQKWGHWFLPSDWREQQGKTICV